MEQDNVGEELHDRILESRNGVLEFHNVVLEFHDMVLEFHDMVWVLLEKVLDYRGRD